MVVATPLYQITRILLATAAGLIGAIIADFVRNYGTGVSRNISTLQKILDPFEARYDVPPGAAPRSWPVSHVLAFVALTIVPRLLSDYAPSPCSCQRCVARRSAGARFDSFALKRDDEEQAPQKPVVPYLSFRPFRTTRFLQRGWKFLLVAHILTLRIIAQDIVRHHAAYYGVSGASSVLLAHIALAHIVMRCFDHLRSGHTWWNHPGQWSKDRISPVQPPLASVADALRILGNLLVGGTILGAVCYGQCWIQQENAYGFIFDPKKDAFSFCAAAALQREFWYLAGVIGRWPYDRIERTSQREWEKISRREDELVSSTWDGLVNLILN